MFDLPLRAPALDDFHAVVKQRGGRWYHACLRITRDAGLAEDAVQDALLKAWDRRDSFRQDAELDTWIHRIALNAALDLVRKRNPDSVDPELLDEHEGTAQSPETHYARQSFGNDLSGAMERLTQLERECFVLKHIEGWPLADIAERQKCTVNNAKQTLFRAVRKLRTDLHDWRGEA
jgi:RNA polymerase sigma-70 factor (ECF subfamily)